MNLPTVVTMDAITFQGDDLYLRTLTRNYDPPVSPQETMTFNGSPIGTSVLTGPFTFTSPTVYLAHHRIIGSVAINTSNSSKTEWSTTLIRSAGVMPLNANQVYSVRPPRTNVVQTPGLTYAQLIASGIYNPVQNPTSDLGILPFDFGHMENPVPASVYYDARSFDCWGKLHQAHCGTITDDEYRPQLAFTQAAWKSIVSDWYDCQRPGLVDPPIALIPAHTISTPELPRYTPAQPGGFFGKEWLEPTAAPALQEKTASTKAIYSMRPTTSTTATFEQGIATNTQILPSEQHKSRSSNPK
jgi:hypothetical protein